MSGMESEYMEEFYIIRNTKLNNNNTLYTKANSLLRKKTLKKKKYKPKLQNYMTRVIHSV